MDDMRRVQHFGLLFMVALANNVLGETTESRLRKDLFSQYDPFSRPPANWTDPLDVYLEFSPLYLNGLNGVEQTFSMYGWLAIKWFDERLIWNPDDYGGIDYITTYPRITWTPDIGIINSVSHLYGDLLDLSEYRGKVTESGWVRVVTAGTIQTTCILDVTYFPFDEQVCHIEMDSWTEPIAQLTLSAEGAVLTMGRLRPNEQWRIIQHWVHSETTSIYDPVIGTSTYQTISFVFRLRRKSMYVGANYLLPCVGVVVMELIVFWLPPDSGEKISLGITLLLAQTVYQLIMQGDMPQTSDSVPLINVYILISMVLSGMIIVSSTIVLSVHHRKPGQIMQPWLTFVVSGNKSAKPIVRCSKTNDTHLQIKWSNRGKCKCQKPLVDGIESEAVGSDPDDSDPNQWVELARVMDRTFFYVYLFLFIIVTIGFLVVISLAQQPVMAPMAGYGYTYDGKRT